MNQSQKDELEQLRNNKSSTIRPTVLYLEEILYECLPVLDHGFIRVIDYMGDDTAIVQAARVSYGTGTKKKNEDRGLINYLLKNSHTSPFEMCEIKLHVKLPIFIARQWVRHRTANINEYSGRYSVMDKEFYVPNIENLAAQSEFNKQGRGEVSLGQEESKRILEILKNDATECYKHYREMLNIDEETQEIIDRERTGLTRELARINLTLNYYTQFYWKIDLHNLLHFLKLRADNHAQFEIRAYANIMANIVQRWVPLTYEAFLNYKQNAVTLSSKALEVLKRKLAGQHVQPSDFGMSQREWHELQDLFDNQI